MTEENGTPEVDLTEQDGVKTPPEPEVAVLEKTLLDLLEKDSVKTPAPVISSGTITANMIASLPVAAIPSLLASAGPVERTVMDVAVPKEIIFQDLKIEAKLVDGLPAVVITKMGQKAITVLSPERPVGRFVIEY
jgi:hypothetical protein